MKKILSEIQTGEFANTWMAENRTGRGKFLAMRKANNVHQIEAVGRELRSMMTFLKKKKEAGIPDGVHLSNMRIFTFDTTLRDGTQGEAVSFSVDDKLLIAQKLDELGIDYIEGGWPGSNPKDKEFFARARELKFQSRPADCVRRDAVRQEPGGQGSFRTRAGGSGHACGGHLRQELGPARPSRAQHHRGRESQADLRDRQVTSRPTGARSSTTPSIFSTATSQSETSPCERSKQAKKAGADVLCLCDTNGGTITSRLAEIVADVRQQFDGVLGIHPHNDTDVAVANALAAVEGGATHVQGCMNGYGERCGNANLSRSSRTSKSSWAIRRSAPTISTQLTAVCRFIAELANLPLRNDQPYVGQSAFAHKGGIHVARC